MVFALAAGNAVRVHLQTATGSAAMRVLRRSVDSFAGPDDPAAVLVADGLTTEPYTLDAGDDLTNGQPVYYRGYDYIGGVWVDQGASFPATPAVAYTPDALDPQEFVRDRIQLGVTSAVALGLLVPPSGAIQVTTAPFSLGEAVTFPTVSVHLESTGPDTRVIGEDFQDYFDDPTQEWVNTEGWIARTTLNVVGVSLNADERIQLRKVLRQVVQSNFSVFGAAGLLMPEFQQHDEEQFTEANVPLYLTSGTLSVTHPAWVRTTEGLINEVTLQPAVVEPPTQPTPDWYEVQDV